MKIEEQKIVIAASILGISVDQLIDGLSATLQGFEIERRLNLPRVRYSVEGLRALKPKNPDIRGDLLGDARGVGQVRVHWDASRSPMVLHKNYVEQVDRI